MQKFEKKIEIFSPINICLVPFHSSIFNQDLIQFASSLMDTVDSESLIGGGRVKLFNGEISKKKIQISIPNKREDILSILDSAKIADVLLCLFPGEAQFDNSCFDPLGYELLTMLRQQGLPGLVLGSVVTAGSKEGIKTVSRFFTSEFGEKGKFIHPLSRSVLTNLRAEPVGRRGRGYMFIEEMSVSGDFVKITGFARGEGFSTETAVNLTGVAGTWMVCNQSGIPALSEEEQFAMVEKLAPLRPAEEQEQTWPTLEEEEAAEQRMVRMAVPKGAASEMEAAWLGMELEQTDDVLDDADKESIASSTDLMAAFDWDTPVEAEEGVRKFQQRTREEMEFVDEVDTPEGTSARKRFAKYRGLKSLRCGNWNPYEELPMDYSQIHEFHDIGGLYKDSLALMKIGNKSVGERITLTLRCIGGSVDVHCLQNCLVASVVAPNESKMTVVHARLSRLPETAHLTIASKEPVIVQCGFRRHTVSPIYSEIPKYSSATGTCPIQRIHRTVPEDTSPGSVLMSFYAPAMFGNNHTVLVFPKEDTEGTSCPLLWGSIAGCAPNRPILVKRITLTGYPFRVHQTKAVIRFMFFDPTDVEWFKPVELSTKKGLRGHIIESLGTHGYMKCRFNGKLTSDDIVCMHLYKRVFPKGL